MYMHAGHLHWSPRLWIAGGVVAVAGATYAAFRAFPLRPPHPAADNFGLAWLLIVPIAIIGGLLVAHGVYRSAPRRRRAPGAALVYPLCAAVAPGLPFLYVALNTHHPAPSGPVLLQVSAVALAVGGIVAGVVRRLDRRQRAPST